jgi:fused signal recognition particle receptor
MDLENAINSFLGALPPEVIELSLRYGTELTLGGAALAFFIAAISFIRRSQKLARAAKRPEKESRRAVQQRLEPSRRAEEIESLKVTPLPVEDEAEVGLEAVEPVSTESKTKEFIPASEVERLVRAEIEEPAAAASLPGAGAPTGIFEGLKKSRRHLFGRLTELFSRKNGETIEQLFSDLEELLVTSDIGIKTTGKLLEALRSQIKGIDDVNEDKVLTILQSEISQILSASSPPTIEPVKRGAKPLVIVIVGVNGAGKTTTIGKLANQFRSKGASVMVGACDTFRAAAADQLAVWAERAGVEIVSGDEGAKPSTVAYQAVHRAMEKNTDVLIIDTAGRLHTRVNLMNELGGVVELIQRELGEPAHEVILVVDGSTGQNALQQAREFNAKTGLTGIIITKLDGTPKGGIVVAIRDELGIPIRYIGVGESIEDLREFDAQSFADALLAKEAASESEAKKPGAIRRRRNPQAGEQPDSPAS